MRPLMFSTTPKTGTFIIFAKLMDFLVSRSETSCGVVTMTKPSMGLMSWATLRASSPVPGGRSIMRKSKSPQSMSARNCFITWCFSGPLQTTGWSGFSSKKAIETTFKFGIPRGIKGFIV